MAVRVPESALRRSMRKRVGYTRYKNLWDGLRGNLKTPDPLILLGIQKLINPTLPWTSVEALRVLVDDIVLQDATDKGELPLLIGHEWRHHSTQEYFERILKG